MWQVFATIFVGMFCGRLISARPIGWLQPLITGAIWLLLYLLGVQVGADPAVVGGIATLGVVALVILLFSLAGSIGASWALGRYVGAKCCAEASSEGEQSLWRAMRGSAVIVAFFAAGCLTGIFTSLPIGDSVAVTGALYALMFLVGVSLGHDRTLLTQIRQLDPRLALLPVATIVGTLAGAAVAAFFVHPSLFDSLAVGAGFGYYSLSSIFIADLRGTELATVALLANVMREIFTLLFAPVVARWFGPLATVSIGGATTLDTTLPVITRSAGRPYAVVAMAHGVAVDFCVPFLVVFFCSI